MPRKHPKVLQAEMAKKAKAKPKLSKREQMQLAALVYVQSTKGHQQRLKGMYYTMQAFSDQPLP